MKTDKNGNPVNVTPGQQGFQKETTGRAGVRGAPEVPAGVNAPVADAGSAVNARLDELADALQDMKTEPEPAPVPAGWPAARILAHSEIHKAADDARESYSMTSGGQWNGTEQTFAGYWGVVRAAAERMGKPANITREQILAAAARGKAEYLAQLNGGAVNEHELNKMQEIHVAMAAMDSCNGRLAAA